MSQETKGSAAKPTWMPKAIGVVVVLIVGAVVAMTQGKKAPEAVATPAGTDVAAASSTTTLNANATFKDGVYSTTGNYMAPSGPETIDVTLTVKDNVVADATVVSTTANPGSKKFQGMFIAGYKESVIGKKLATLSLSKTSGSSLTPKGFNDALNEIRTQASV